MKLGFLISFAGNLTYPKAQPLRDVAAKVPLDLLLVETDAPFLAPIPNRGQRNEPAWGGSYSGGFGGTQGNFRRRNSLDHHEKLRTAVLSDP